jgi:peptidoglycan L-alanyl-D-glutamate endopeptidase CwlK
MALHISDVDFAVVEGLRTPERQQQLYAQGRTAPGKIVTWTMASKHLKQADGWGHAVDLLPINPATGKLDWNYANGFAELGDAMASAADYLDIEIRWGADWDQDGIEHERGENDSPHFELV